MGQKRKRFYGGPAAPRAIRKKQRRVSARNYKLTKPMKSLVNREINRSHESKERFYYPSLINVDSAIGNSDWYNIIPAVVQGDTRENREGAEITLLSLTIKGFIRMTPDGSSTGDALAARLLVVSPKRQSRVVNVTDLSNNLLRDGANQTNYDGTLSHHYFPTNTGYVTTHYDRSFYMTTDHINYVDGGTIGNSQDTRTSQRIVVRPFFIRMRVKGKKLKYFDNGEQYPENFSPRIALGFANMNTDAFDSATRLSYFYQVKMRWKG